VRASRSGWGLVAGELGAGVAHAASLPAERSRSNCRSSARAVGLASLTPGNISTRATNGCDDSAWAMARSREVSAGSCLKPPLAPEMLIGLRKLWITPQVNRQFLGRMADAGMIAPEPTADGRP